MSEEIKFDNNIFSRKDLNVTRGNEQNYEFIPSYPYLKRHEALFSE